MDNINRTVAINYVRAVDNPSIKEARITKDTLRAFEQFMLDRYSSDDVIWHEAKPPWISGFSAINELQKKYDQVLEMFGLSKGCTLEALLDEVIKLKEGAEMNSEVTHTCGAPATQRDSGILEAQGQIDKSIDVLKAAVVDLSDRLGPLMRKVPPDGKVTQVNESDNKADERCDIAHYFFLRAVEINVTAARIRGLISTLDI